MSNQLNFSQQMDEVLKTLGASRPRLLLHACCAPCSSAVLERLREHFSITILYYNPNIYPPQEYHRREQELERFLQDAGMRGGVLPRARANSSRPAIITAPPTMITSVVLGGIKPRISVKRPNASRNTP